MKPINSTWSCFPWDVFLNSTGYLNDPFDLLAIGKVCKSWQKFISSTLIFTKEQDTKNLTELFHFKACNQSYLEHVQDREKGAKENLSLVGSNLENHSINNQEQADYFQLVGQNRKMELTLISPIENFFYIGKFKDFFIYVSKINFVIYFIGTDIKFQYDANLNARIQGVYLYHFIIEDSIFFVNHQGGISQLKIINDKFKVIKVFNLHDTYLRCAHYVPKIDTLFLFDSRSHNIFFVNLLEERVRKKDFENEYISRIMSDQDNIYFFSCTNVWCYKLDKCLSFSWSSETISKIDKFASMFDSNYLYNEYPSNSNDQWLLVRSVAIRKKNGQIVTGLPVTSKLVKLWKDNIIYIEEIGNCSFLIMQHIFSKKLINRKILRKLGAYQIKVHSLLPDTLNNHIFVLVSNFFKNKAGDIKESVDLLSFDFLKRKTSHRKI